MIDQEVDVLIIGGGLIGAAFLLAMQSLGYSTLLIDAKSLNQHTEAEFDARSLALSPASKSILKQVGLWDLINDEATAIKTIHVSDQYHFGTSSLRAAEGEALGYVVELHALSRGLHQLLPTKQVLAPAVVKGIDLEAHTAQIKFKEKTLTIKAG